MINQIVVLLLPIAVLLAGAISLLLLSSIPSKRSLGHKLGLAIAILELFALFGLIAHTKIQDLSIQFPGSILIGASISLAANPAGTRLGLALVIISLSAVLANYYRSNDRETKSDDTGWLDWFLIVSLLASGLLVLIPANLRTLALAWTILDGTIAVALLLTTSRASGSLIHWSAGAIGTLFLWCATLPLQASDASQELASLTIMEGWMGTVLILAIICRLAPFPFHLGRPFLSAGSSRQPALLAILQIIPMVAGLGLLVQVSDWQAMPYLSRQFFTVLLLTGIAGTGLLAWLPSESPRMTRWVLTGQAGMVILAGLWVGADAALAEGLVLLLAGGLLSLCAHAMHDAPEIRLVNGIGIAILAGLPLTFDGDGRLAVYQAWIDAGVGLYLIVAAGSYLLLIGAAATHLFRPASTPTDRNERLIRATGFMLPVIALCFRSGPFSATSIAAWLATLGAIAGGFFLAWKGDSLKPLQNNIEPWLHPILSLGWLRRLLGSVGSAAGQFTHGAHEVLEGEGAFLWLLVSLSIAWLLLSAG